MSTPDGAPSPGSPHADPLAFFARRMAHDLNNVATIVRSYSELLLADLTPESPAATDAAEIRLAAEELVAYLKRVSRFARASLARPVDLPLADAVTTTVRLLQQEEPGGEVLLEGTTTARVHADPTWLDEVLRELVRNAREASPEERAVIVRLGDDGQWATVSVIDEGAGFAPEIDAHAEHPFVTTKDGVRGAGFGLTIASAFAGGCGGTLVRARDDARATTTVSLRLPVVA